MKDREVKAREELCEAGVSPWVLHCDGGKELLLALKACCCWEEGKQQKTGPKKNTKE